MKCTDCGKPLRVAFQGRCGACQAEAWAKVTERASADARPYRQRINAIAARRLRSA